MENDYTSANDYSITPLGLVQINKVRSEYLAKAKCGVKLTAHEMFVIGMVDDPPWYEDCSREAMEAVLVILEKAYIAGRDLDEEEFVTGTETKTLGGVN